MTTFAKICKDIKEVKIQGARNIAKAALIAYSLNPTKSAKKKLLGLRPTEPMLINVLNVIGKKSKKEILNHFNDAQDRINKFAMKIIKNKMLILTHCHSTNVVNALIYAKKNGKKLEGEGIKSNQDESKRMRKDRGEKGKEARERKRKRKRERETYASSFSNKQSVQWRSFLLVSIIMSALALFFC